MSITYNTTPTATDVGFQTLSGKQTQHALYQCLVISQEANRQRQFEVAAGERGWKSIVCDEVDRARARIGRNSFHLAIVDLGAGDASGFSELTEVLARDHDALLVVCGGEDNPAEEIWARQIGAWLYLPGVDADSDLSMIYDEAPQRGGETKSAKLVGGLTGD